MAHPRITINPEIHGGRPCVAGTRIPVYMVQELLRSGASVEEIPKDYYPNLTPEDIQACAGYKPVTEKHRGVHRRMRATQEGKSALPPPSGEGAGG
ncbi:MAG: DUF433 domain-containing protein [Chloroflexi bacterium]|nr:DUF433 domain-containing protein [Chloroflexota bacterium]